LTIVVAGRLAKGAKNFQEVAAYIKQEFPAHYEAFVRNGQKIYTDAKVMHSDSQDRTIHAPAKAKTDEDEVQSGTQPAVGKTASPAGTGAAQTPKRTTGPTVTTASVGVRSAQNPTPTVVKPPVQKASASSTSNNRRPKGSEVNAPSFEPITQETKEAPNPVEIPATNRGMLKFRRFGFLFLILAAIGAVIFVPSGDPTTYGRQESPSFELIWLIQSGRVIDMGRVWTQTFILVAAAAACFYFSEKDKQS